MSAYVTYLPNALSPVTRRELAVPPASIRGLAPTDWQVPYIALVDGEPVLRADWELVVEDDHCLAFVDVRALPQGGGGGSNPLATIALLALMVYAPYLAAGLYGALGGTFVAANAGLMLGIAQAAVVLVGSVLINAILPPPKPTTAQSAASLAAASPTYNIQAQGNTARLEAAIPEHFGRLLAYPDFAAQPYQEFAGNDQFLYHLLCIGRGAYDIEAIRIEDTPLARFDEVTYEVIQPGGTLSMFPANVVSSIEVAGQALPCPTGTYTQVGTVVTVTCTAHGLSTGHDVYLSLAVVTTTGSNTNYAIFASYDTTVTGAPTEDTFTVTLPVQPHASAGAIISPWAGGYVANDAGTTANFIGLDFAAPKGFYFANTDGSLASRSANVAVQYRALNSAGAPTSTWMPLVGKQYSGATTTPQRYSERVNVAAGRYEVRVRRSDLEPTDSPAERLANAIVWAGLRAYLQDTRTFGDVTLLAVRMRATNNLTAQASRKLNVIATRKLPIWNGSSWSALTATRSPAWAFSYACKQVGLSDAQIDLATLLTLSATWAARGDALDARFDSFLGFWEAATKIAGAGRAKPYMQGGVMRIKRDQASSIPVALFSMRNIVKGSFSVDYLMPTVETADAVDVAYFDRTTWKPARVRATLPGSTAARPAKVDLFGVTDRDQAFREGMYQAASNRYRRRIVSFKTEQEGFIPSYGDLIAIQHDMPGWGQGGEVEAWDPGTRTLTCTEPLTWSTGAHYVGLRKRDGSVDGPYSVTAGALPNQLVLATAPAFTPYTGGNEERTHYAFGWAETWRQRALVLSARPSDGYTIEIQAVVEDDNVHTAETGRVTPVAPTSQLAGYTNAPPLYGLAARFLFNERNRAIVTWQPSAWANEYRVEVSSGDGVWTAVGNPVATELTIAAAYGNSTLVRVAAVGLARGAWVQVPVQIVAPFNPGAITYTVETLGVRLQWPSSLEIDNYEIRVDGIDWESATLVAEVTGNQYLWAAQQAATHTIRIKALDINGNYSAIAAVAAVTITGPSAPVITYSISGPDEQLAWTIPSSGFSVDRYELRYGAAWASAAFVDTTKATSYRRKVDYAGTRRYWVCAIDIAENQGPPTSLDVNISAPSAANNLRAEVIDNNVLLYWAPPSTGTLPVDRYEVRKGDTWATGTTIGSNGNSTFATVFEQQSGTYTYWTAAVDSAGNNGTPSKVSAFVNQPPDYVLHTDLDSDFSGSKVNALAEAGMLLVPVNTTETWASHFTSHGWASPQDQISAGYPLYLSPNPGTASYTEDYDYGASLPATNIIVVLDSTPLAGTVTTACQIRYKLAAGDAWTNAPAGATSVLASNFRYVQVVYTFTTASAASLLRVNGLNIKLSIKSRSDSGAGVSAIGGTPITFSYPFISADTPIVQANGLDAYSKPYAVAVIYVGTVNPTGATVLIFNSAGAQVAGVPFSYSIKGY